jgi:hypothetical protein
MEIISPSLRTEIRVPQIVSKRSLTAGSILSTDSLAKTESSQEIFFRRKVFRESCLFKLRI